MTGITEDSAPAKEVKDNAEPLKAPSPALQADKAEDRPKDEEEPKQEEPTPVELEPAAPEAPEVKPGETGVPAKVEEAQETPQRHSPLPEVLEQPPSVSKEVTPAPLEPEVPFTSDAPAVVPDGKGVGDSMVDGEEEAELGKATAVEPAEEKAVDDLQPMALDSDFAEVVTRIEVDEREEGSGERKITPPPTREEEPAPVASGSRSPPRLDARPTASNGREAPRPAPRPAPRDDAPAVGMDDRPSKRSREDDDEPPSKRFRSTYTTSLPRSLSHLSHPPTSNLYITNLRRPLLIPALHDYLLPARHPADLLPTPKGPFASDEHPGLWLSGVKDHAYATYPSVEDALETAEKIEGVVWPEDTGDKLHVEFIPDEELRGLVEREEFAWATGRQKLSLSITQDDDGDVRFELVGGGAIGGSRGLGQRGSVPGLSGAPAEPPRGPAVVPLSGANSIGAPTGPSRGLPIRGRGGFGPPLGLGRSDPGMDGGRFGRPGSGAEGRIANPMKRTMVRPSLFYREGPGGEV